MAAADYLSHVPEIVDRDPHTAPSKHVVADDSDQGWAIADGRRPSRMLLVNELRAEVDEWRADGYAGLSPTTRRLFQWWFEELPGSAPGAFNPYWGQREAVETIVYLAEVAKVSDAATLISEYASAIATTLLEQGHEIDVDPEGNRLLRWNDERGQRSEKALPPPDLARYACKMATGSGKTMVMSLLIVWSYFHARREPGSALATNFLVLAPNVIVFERLRTDFEDLAVFRQCDLVPPEWSLNLKVILRGDASEPSGSGNLIVTNIQQLHERAEDWSPANAVDALLGRRPTQNIAQQGRPILDRIRGLDHLMVMNDEAHHVHDTELVWHQTLENLHERLPRGLTMWLDFSATPRGQDGVTFPWVICDYPLAQAVEDRIVKAPMILHMVDHPDPTGVKKDNVIDKYGDWLTAGVERLRQHQKDYKSIAGVKPVMFVMCESVQHADEVGRWLHDRAGGKLKANEVLVIHTDTKGEVKKSELDELRRVAREIDDPHNPVKAVVSVLILREGWDVRNVTVVLGLRPGTAKAQILPEQAVGRGLRLMRQVGPDQRQVLEVLGTPAFEDFVKELEGEGVFVPTVTKKPTAPITIQPVKDKLALDIEIPKTSSGLERVYRRLDTFDPSKAAPVFPAGPHAKSPDLVLVVKDAMTDAKVGTIAIDVGEPLLWNDLLASIVNKTQEKAHLTGEFATLTPMIDAYLQQRCFGRPVDPEADDTRWALGPEWVRERIATFLARLIGELVTEKKAVEVEADPIRLSETTPFHWRRNHLNCAKTVFNFVATWNPFESSFATFLERCDDITRFAALAEHFTGFWVDYLKPSGAIGRYFPDWVAVQAVDGAEVNWIIETKGRVWDGTEAKDAAIDYWCEQVSASTGEPWRYMRVDQPIFKPEKLSDFAALVDLIEERRDATDQPTLLLGPA